MEKGKLAAGGENMGHLRLRILSVLVLYCIFMVACTPQSTPNTMEQTTRNQTIQPRTVSNTGVNNQKMIKVATPEKPIGYVRLTRPQTNQANMAVDRQLLAQNISQMVSMIPGVKEVSTLVTDDHVFIGIQPTQAKLSEKTRAEIRRTGKSVTPRYFKVHISDHKKTLDQINQIGTRTQQGTRTETTQKEIERLLRQLGDNTPPTAS